MQRKLAFFVLLFLFSILTACSKDSTEISDTTKEKLKVVTASVKAQSISKAADLSGSLRAGQEALVSFEVPGKVTLLAKKEGDSVEKGDLLAVIDEQGYQISVEQAEAGVAQADAGLEQVQKGARQQELQQAKALVDKAQAGYKNTLQEFNRVKALYKEGAVAQSVYDAAFTALTLADKDITLTKQGYSLALEGASAEQIKQALGAYKMAASVKQQANLALTKTKLSAPFNATVVSKLTSEGQLVSAGVPIYRIGNIDELKVILPVPDYEIKDWKLGDKVMLFLYDEEREGRVSTIFPTASQGTGTIAVEVSVSNPQHDWFVGQVVLAKHNNNSNSNLYIPVEAVISRGEDKPYVFKVSNNKAIKTYLEVGELIKNQYKVISGLKAGEQIIVKGADRVYDGQPIAAVRGN